MDDSLHLIFNVDIIDFPYLKLEVDLAIIC